MNISKVLKTWILTSFVIFVACVAAYSGTQQNFRQSAYDPEVAMAEDIAWEMQSGTYQPGISNLNKIDISKSLDPFVIVYDKSEKVISSNATLNNQTPMLPIGVFTGGRDRLTWEPESGVRIATVIKPFSSATTSGYVVVGRSLREVESRIETVGIQYMMGFVVATAGSLILIVVLELLGPAKRGR